MLNRKLTLIAVFLLSVILMTTFVTLRQRAQENSKSQEDEFTPIQLRTMTEKQKKNSKRYNRPSETPSLLGENKNIRRVIGTPFITETDFDDSISSQEIRLQKHVCDSEAVITGKITNKTSQLSEDSKSVFTDYEFKINTVIKSNSSLNLQSGNNITITISGGAVKIDSYKIEVIDRSYKRLKVNGEYLLFLNYFGDSDSFTVNSSEGTVEIQNNQIALSKEQTLHRKGDNNLVIFTDDITKIAQQCNR